MNYSLDKYIDTDYIEILKKLNTETSILDSKIKKTYEDELYYTKIKDLSFILNSGSKPFTISDENISEIKPIIKSLISKGQLSKEILDIFL